MKTPKRILIMGLPGSGKTYFAERLKRYLEDHVNPINEHSLRPIADARVTVTWLNADDIRTQYNDWDFSPEGRRRQAQRMRAVADKGCAAEFIMLCDFVCPTRELREIFDADFTVWMDTIPKSKYKDTNAIFERPTEDEYDIRIDEFASDKWSETLADLIHMLLP